MTQQCVASGRHHLARDAILGSKLGLPVRQRLQLRLAGAAEVGAAVLWGHLHEGERARALLAGKHSIRPGSIEAAPRADVVDLATHGHVQRLGRVLAVEIRQLCQRQPHHGIPVSLLCRCWCAACCCRRRGDARLVAAACKWAATFCLDAPQRQQEVGARENNDEAGEYTRSVVLQQLQQHAHCCVRASTQSPTCWMRVRCWTCVGVCAACGRVQRLRFSCQERHFRRWPCASPTHNEHAGVLRVYSLAEQAAAAAATSTRGGGDGGTHGGGSAAAMATGQEVSRAAEDKLTYKLSLAAEVKCADLINAYNSCVTGRTVSAAWACRAAYHASQACIAEYVNAPNIQELKRRWLDAGRPQYPDWPQLLEGVVAPEHMQLPRRQQPGSSGGGSGEQQQR